MPEPSSFFRHSHVFLSPHHQPGTPWSWTPTFSSIQKGWNYLFQFNLAKWRAQDARLLFIALISKQASYLAPKLQDNSSDFPACFSWGQNGDFSYAAVMTHKQPQNLEKDQFKWVFSSATIFLLRSHQVPSEHKSVGNRKRAFGETPTLTWVNLLVKSWYHVQMYPEDTWFLVFMTWRTSHCWIAELAPCPGFHDEGQKQEQTVEDHEWSLDHAAMVQWELGTTLYLTEFYTEVNVVQDREESGT